MADVKKPARWDGTAILGHRAAIPFLSRHTFHVPVKVPMKRGHDDAGNIIHSAYDWRLVEGEK